MKITYRQQLLFPFFQPPLFCKALALGTMAVTTRVIGYPLFIAIVAQFYVSAKIRCAATEDIAYHFIMLIRYTVFFSVIADMGFKNISNLHMGSIRHHCPPMV